MPIDATQPYDDNNIFARILRGELPCKKVHEDEFSLAFHDINPQAPFHVLIIPKKHIESVGTLTPDDSGVLCRMFEVAGKLAKELGIDRDGYRVVSNVGTFGQQSVPHLHLHLIGGRQMKWPPG